MVGEVASVIVMLEHYGERHGVVGLLFPPFAPLFTRGDAEVVAVIGYLGASPDPALLVQPVSCDGEH